ncbi:protein lin-37 homolog [Topomyia yanbarensis]|uniref:protein lin-37 homolog n=1 Tax=Topomyia yanbarensis TaxID=2498891 RepID=UPI00273AEB81|nr:protein lin-37 homolog [Topomyia yanbarensis]
MSMRRNLLDSAEKRRSLQNVALARGRLKGALQDVVTQSDDDAGDESDEQREIRYSKRLKTSAPESIAIPHQSYIMKLFDRSVDLARFDESTPLYPICRSWMQNQPRLNPNRLSRPSSPIKRERNAEMADQYRNHELKEIRAMPAPDPAVYSYSRCPSPVGHNRDVPRTEIDFHAEPISKAVLMAEHKQNWGQVRRKWQDRGRLVDQRYAASFELLDALLQKS